MASAGQSDRGAGRLTECGGPDEGEAAQPAPVEFFATLPAPIREALQQEGDAFE